MAFDGGAGVEPRFSAPQDPVRETRCYAVTGSARVLDSLEAVMGRIAWVGERGAVRLVSVFVDGRRGPTVTVRVLASWQEDEETGGAALPRPPEGEAIQAHYVIDVVG